MKPVTRYLRLAGATGKVRIASFQNREHVVVPVVALMETVIRASNSKQWEFVPAKVLSEHPAQWNGRPVIPQHPKHEEEALLANDPQILEQMQFGTLFYSRTENKQLLFEAWLDPARADLVGANAQMVIRKAKAGEPIEVSIGASVLVEQKSGVHEGRPYEGIWTAIQSDHLAMFGDSTRGACNNDMGCGVPRMAEEFNMPADVDDKKTLRERVLAMLKFRQGKAAADMSDSELRQMLGAALRADEPGYLGIDQVFPGENLVIYATMPKDEIELFRRGYSMSKDAVSLKEKKERVEPVTRYEKVGAEENQPCGCQDRSQEGAEDMKTKAERVKALIENPNMKLVATQQKTLEEAPDSVLEVLEANAKILDEKTTAEKAAADKAAADKAAADKITADAAAATAAETATRAAAAATQPKTMDEYIAAAPPELRDVLRENVRVAKEHKASVIKALKDTGKCDYTDAELEGKTADELAKLVKLCGAATKSNVVDFSGRGAPRAADEGAPGKVEAPPKFHSAVRAAAGIKE